MLKVLNPGLLTTVQDLGRWGYQAFGMPVAGAMDRLACKTANYLLGNRPTAAVLEFTMMGGEYQFLTNTYIALTGANMMPMLNGIPVSMWSTIKIASGDVLTLTYAKTGCRCYLAVAGGLDLPLVLGSRATYTRAKVGGLEGRALKKTDIINFLPTELPTQKLLQLPTELQPVQPKQIILRVLLGPQADDFTEQGKKALFSNIYTISNEADRMGYRLEGEVIEHATKPDIVSDALCQGAVQIPGHGRPIIMMADRQTTGGYTKIGSVIGSDLRLLAQAKPGDEVSFQEVTDSEAVVALAEEQEYYKKVQDFVENTANHANHASTKLNLTVNGKNYFVEIQEKYRSDSNELC